MPDSRQLAAAMLVQVDFQLTILAASLNLLANESSNNSGVRSMYPDETRGKQTIAQLRHGHPERLFNLTRLKIHVFEALLAWIIDRQIASTSGDDRFVSLDQKLFIFLHICATGSSYRQVAEFLQHSTQTVSSCFHEILEILLHLHKEVVKLPDETSSTPDWIKFNPKLFPFFENCRGALDGTHVPAWVLASEQPAWRNRKGWVSQNVFAAVDFDMNFIFVLPGWEGSANDSRVLAHAKAQGFKAPPGCFYLADNGYSNRDPLVLVPYQKTRYHLCEQYATGRKPATKEELFNLRHSQARNVVERAFGVLKKRFKILALSRHGFSLSTQIKLIFALTAIHNFMNSAGMPATGEDEGDSFQDPMLNSREEETAGETDYEGEQWKQQRDEMAEAMWQSYVHHTNHI